MHLPSTPQLAQITDDKKFTKTSEDELHDKFFADADKAKKYVNLIHFEPFADTADAVTAAAACIDGKVPKSLKSFLKKQLKKSGKGDSLAILDKNLVTGIKEAVPNLGCTLACDAKTHELFRGIRCYLDELMEAGGGGDDDDGPTVSEGDLTAMRLGLSHSLSRYKLKFSADKVDTMVIQAIGLLDELDKEINTYAMRVKEWYGWHFPGECACCSNRLHSVSRDACDAISKTSTFRVPFLNILQSSRGLSTTTPNTQSLCLHVAIVQTLRTTTSRKYWKKSLSNLP